MLKLSSVLFIFLVFSQLAFGQEDQYLFPINPNQQNYLAGTMGELRGSHFHGGIDIKTGGVTGLPVYSTNDGYISRIKVSPVGYGNALYIYHPKDGTTSVYGHLDKFEGRIADYVLKEQYKRKSFDIDLNLSSTLFPVHKGDLIAYSGNTGGSSGPHLHFEIRDNAQRPLNPLHYNFSEVKDNIAPYPQLFALRALNQQSRVDDQYQTVQYSLRRSGSDYYGISKPEVWGEIGLMIMGYDLLNGVPNRNGIPHITTKLDGHVVSEIEINQVPFSHNREILVFRDYDLKKNSNRSFQKVYKDEGMTIDVYRQLLKGGKICIDDTLEHEIEIELEDAYKNKSVIHLTVVGKKPPQNLTVLEKNFRPFGQKVDNNTLVFMGKKEKTNGLISEIYANRMKYELLPSYYVNDYAIYHWDLRKGLPDSINVCHEYIFPELDIMIPSGKDFNFFTDFMDISFRKYTLFDTLFLQVNYEGEMYEDKELFLIGNEDIPLRSSFTAKVKPKKEYKNRDKVAAYWTSNMKYFSYEGGGWEGDKFEFRSRTFGTFTLLEDTVPPTLKIYQQNQNKISCRINDDLSGIKDYKVTVNGEWVLMQYDAKNNYISSEKLDNDKPFSGEMVITITDNANNTKVYKSNI